MNGQVRSILHTRLFWILSLLIVSIISLTIGVKDFNLFGIFTNSQEDINLAIVSRIPRLISILVTGSSLSIAGLIMQTITGNKFVSPSTAGTMEWSRFGVMLAILFFGGQASILKMFIAFVTSLAGTIVFMQLLQKMRFKNAMVVPLVGMMLGNVISAITSFFAYRFDIIQNMSSWLQGNFSLVIKGRYELLYLGIPFLFIAYFYANKFTIAGMGESFSKNLGLNHRSVVSLGLVIVAVITSTVVVTVGSISFVGIIIPNIVTMFMGDNLKNSLPVTAIVGALFLLVCDMIGRLILFPYEVSISVIVSVLGSILFLLLLFRRKSKWNRG
ncbi:MAG: iron chelate uptake ABC transporter family permease subunit [Clostridiales bacterium]|nr:iron chelate uptake ABC transporter family permease subunit [Clostridiales bacterium]